MSYNGWSNYETRCVKLWLDSEEGSCRLVTEQARQCLVDNADEDEEPDTVKENAISDMRDFLESFHEENMPELAGVYSDILRAAMGEVDWHEIATAYIEDAIAEEE